MLNMENRGCLVIICKCGGILDACDDPKVVLGDVEYKHDEEDWFGLNIWKIHGTFQLLKKCSIKSIKRRIHS